MADPLSSLEKVLKLALSIKRAMETVRQNHEECYRIRIQVGRLSAILDQLHRDTEMASNPTMSGALEDLAETMDRALQLVTKCQKKHTIVSFFTAGGVAKQLLRVRGDMSDHMMVAVMAITAHATILLGEQIENRRRPSPSEEHAGRPPSPEVIQVIQSLMVRGENIPGDSIGSLSCNACSVFALGGYNLCQHLFACFSHLLSELVFNLERYCCIEGVFDYPLENSPMVVTNEGDIREPSNQFSMSELENATHNFSEDNIIGQGAFATVYKGVLHGHVVAIKKIQYQYHPYMARISDVAKLEHKNIVQILGYGHGGDEDNSVFLVEEYMPHGSMDKIIYGSQFDWSSRLRLIQEMAHGVHYLHEQQFLHLDLKPSNILVDSDINPKITDFGRAKMLAQGDDVASCDTGCLLAGTMGYMPPEYIIDGILSKMYDVYSFGVILLEIISGMSRSEPARHHASIEWAWVAREAGRMEELLDPSLCAESQLKEVRRCMEVGLLCTQSDPADRPTMLYVVHMLDNKTELPTPLQPEYTKLSSKKLKLHGT